MKITKIFLYFWSTTISSPVAPIAMVVCVKYTFRQKWRATQYFFLFFFFLQGFKKLMPKCFFFGNIALWIRSRSTISVALWIMIIKSNCWLLQVGKREIKQTFKALKKVLFGLNGHVIFFSKVFNECRAHLIGNEHSHHVYAQAPVFVFSPTK